MNCCYSPCNLSLYYSTNRVSFGKSWFFEEKMILFFVATVPSNEEVLQLLSRTKSVSSDANVNCKDLKKTLVDPSTGIHVNVVTTSKSW